MHTSVRVSSKKLLKTALNRFSHNLPLFAMLDIILSFIANLLFSRLGFLAVVMAYSLNKYPFLVHSFGAAVMVLAH